MKRFAAMILALCLLLSGCSTLLDGSYHSAKPHEEQQSSADDHTVAVSSYTALCRALGNMVESGSESFVISVEHYDQLAVTRDMRSAIQEVMTNNPIGAYAVDEITFELGTNAGQPAVAVTVRYHHDRTEIRKIQTVSESAEVREAIAAALDNCEPGLVLYVENFEQLDYAQWATDYGAQNPDKVMEQPQVTANIYPETGDVRVVELKFTYQNSREALRNMQEQVQVLFDEAVDYVSDTEKPEEKYQQIYAFLMERFEEYQQDTSITPAYSLLIHGVGDAKAFAWVYSAMCRMAGLECIVVTGTRAGEPWYWNIVCRDGVYYHVDVLKCDKSGAFRMEADGNMSGYVWDYSAYPACGVTE